MNRVARVLLLFGVIFLVLFISISVLFFLSPAHLSSTVFINPKICNVSCMCDVDICAGGGGPPPLSEITINGMLIAYQWPDQINLNSSDAISVEITSNNAIAASKLTATTTGNYRLAGATPEEVGTPGQNITKNGVSLTTVKDAFGAKYQVFATVQLLAATFDVKTFDLSEQSLDQGSVSWLWNIKPNAAGSQVVGLALNILWKPINGGQVIQHQVWQTQMPITVTQPFLDRGQLSVGALITGALASGGLITGIITQFVTSGLEQFTKKREKKREDTQPKSEKETAINQQEDDQVGVKENGEAAQSRSDKENKTEVNQQEDDHPGEDGVQKAKNTVQSPSGGIRSLLQRRGQALSPAMRLLLLTLILLIIGGSIAIYYAKVLHPAQLRAQATVAATNKTAIALAQQTATVTSAQHLLNISTAGSITLNDSLSGKGSNNGWTQTPNCAFTKGSYHATIAQRGHLFACIASSTSFTDFAYQVQVSIDSGDEGCLFLRFNNSANTAAFTAFCTDTTGNYDFIAKRANITTYSVLQSGFISPFRIGIDKINSLTVIARGLHYTTYINNRYCLTITDNTTSKGAIGVGALDDFNATVVAFSNAKVWKLS